jgi:hypothetical protein
MDEIRDRFGTTYAVTRSTLHADGTVICYAHAGEEAIARAVVEVFKGCISDVLVCKEADIARPLQPSRIRSAAGRKFWASRR